LIPAFKSNTCSYQNRVHLFYVKNNYKKIHNYLPLKKIKLDFDEKFIILTHVEKQRLKQKIILSVDEEMVLIPAGGFWMGDDKGEFNEQPEHLVYLDNFYIDKYEVTNRKYKIFCDAAKRSYPPEPEFEGMTNYFVNYPDYPVVKVSWEDANAYAQWAGKRLPTEAEWEKAVRSGLISKNYAWGDSLNLNKANLAVTNGEDKWFVTAPVGSSKPNEYGIFDIVGNVKERCYDWYMERAENQETEDWRLLAED